MVVIDPELAPLAEALAEADRLRQPADSYTPHHTCVRGPRAGKPSGQLQFHRATHPIRVMAPGNGWGGTTAMGYEVDAWCRHTNRWQKTPDWPIKAIWFCPEFRQMAMVLTELRNNCFGTVPKFRESGFGGPHLEWPDTSKLYLASYDRDWSHIQGIEVDLVAFDEQPPASLYREMKQRRRGKRQTRFICKATQTTRDGWMREMYDEWLHAHHMNGYDEEGAMLVQEHRDLWVWPRGGIHDNPGASDEDVEWYERQKWPTEQERQIRLFGGFESLGTDAYFPSTILEPYKAAHGRDPMRVGSVGCSILDVFERESIVAGRKIEQIGFSDDPSGPWRFWQGWEGDRPTQSHAYCMGVDLAYGLGASNSVFSVADVDTREKIAEFASSGVTPEQAAMIAAMFGLWIGGRLRSALICWETNGPGESFAREIQRLRYSNLFREKRLPSAVEAHDPGRLGWRSGPSSKEILLSDYRAALMTGRFVNPSMRALESCASFRTDEKGRIVSEGEHGADGARAPHGDFVIADGLCWLACQHAGKLPIPELPAPRGTLAHVLKQEMVKVRAKQGQEKW